MTRLVVSDNKPTIINLYAVYVTKVIDVQHKMTYGIHRMIREEMRLINDTRKQNDSA